MKSLTHFSQNNCCIVINIQKKYNAQKSNPLFFQKKLDPLSYIISYTKVSTGHPQKGCQVLHVKSCMTPPSPLSSNGSYLSPFLTPTLWQSREHLHYGRVGVTWQPIRDELTNQILLANQKQGSISCRHHFHLSDPHSSDYLDRSRMYLLIWDIMEFIIDISYI